MWIDRHIESLLLQRAATRPAVVLTGARQTGKTSLMRRLFPNHAFVTLDLPSEAEQAERDPDTFLARHPPPVNPRRGAVRARPLPPSEGGGRS